MAPIQYAWFAYLAHQYPIGANNKTSAVAWRVLLDQVVFSLISLGLFFAYMTFTEGGGIRSLRRKLSAVFLPAL